VTSVVLNESVRTILLDIEGTTTPLDFVHHVLFPYARSHVRPFLEQQLASPDVRADVAALRQEHLVDVRQDLNPPSLRNDTPATDFESLVQYIQWLTERDRKSTPLKSLQGKVWEEGYRTGELRSPIFGDVPSALRRWQEQARNTCIFSSGSVLAQKLLFAHTTAGDLTAHISGYFDTSGGAKTDPESYVKIARALQQSPSEAVFISDVSAELDAAQAAGFWTLLCYRPGNRPQPANKHVLIFNLDKVFA
jgi:enolase-phosphatase E1